MLLAFACFATTGTSQVFTPMPPLPSVAGYGVATGDIDADGDLDVVVLGPSQLRVFRNNMGTLTPSTVLSCNGSPFDCLVGDWNGDGRPDIASSSLSGVVDVFLATNAGWAASAYVVGSESYQLVAADLNGDGYLDLATGNYRSSNVSVLINNGPLSPGTFSVLSFPSGGQQPVGIAAGDWNGDGITDLAVSHYYRTPNLSLLINNGFATGFALVDAHFGSASVASYEITSGDFNGDGRVDIAMAASSGPIQVFYNPASLPTPWTGQLIATQPFGYAVGIVARDIDGDGQIDLVHSYAGTAAGGTHIYLNRGTAPWPATRFGTSGTWKTALADIDGDGREDLITNDASPSLVVWRNATQAPASASFGVGTFGSRGVASLSLSAPPRLGTTTNLQSRGVPPSSQGVLIIGSEIPGLQVTPDLTLYVQGVALPWSTSATGTLSLPLTIPSDPRLMGATAATQFLVVDRPANLLGVVGLQPLRLFLW